MVKENRMSIWRALYGWIDQPRKTLRYVSLEPRWPLWLAPALAIVIALVVVTVVSAPSASELARTQAERQLAAQMGSLSG
ncbi:MAG TPA: hypothetical protein ENO24_02695, partial [Chloroflexi bacterium]|nr:hypothetical protein [Chloroflexota bacterium]